ncbi:MAG: hypothetical protein KIY11_07065 [Thermoplasmata archaeon]|nr:hypothetical protein [Candidatus Sysuiplasma acidicola]
MAEMKLGTVRPCTGESYVVYPAPIYDLPLGDCAKALRRNGFAAREEGAMVVVQKEDVSFTLYRTGRLLVLPCRTAEEAVRRSREIFSVLEDDRRVSQAIGSAELI